MTVFRHGKSWWYDFRFLGVRYRERISATNRDLALQQEEQRRAELRASLGQRKSPACSLRFVDFAYKEFAPWSAVEHGDRPTTHARYMRSVKALVRFFGHHTLYAINAGLVEQYKIARSQQPRKNARDGRLVTRAAVNRDLAVLRILFNFAIRLGKVATNPVAQVKFFREEQLHMRVLTDGEQERYLACASQLLRDVAVLMLETGMRPGEIYRLKTSDVDLVLRSVSVRSGKTVNAARHIPLTKRALEVVGGRLHAVKTQWLFPCPFDDSKPLREVRKAHDAAVVRAGIQPRFRLYDLRHTALSRMAMAGIDLPTLKELAGHSQIQMTMRYVHPTPEHKRRAIEKFEIFEAESSVGSLVT
jgi:integrase